MLYFLDPGGQQVREPVPAPRNLSWFDVMRFGGGNSLVHALAPILVVSSQGRTVLKYVDKWMRTYTVHESQAAAVRLVEDAAPYLAVLHCYEVGLRTSMLYLFSPEGGLVYQESIPITCALCAAPARDGNGEVLLVAGRWQNCIWQYRITAK